MKKNFTYLIFCLILLFFTYSHLQNQIHNFLAEKLFLKYHKNALAIKVLEFVSEEKKQTRKDFYNYFLLGRIYFVNGKLSKSIENYNKSIELNNLHKESYYGRGLTYGFMGNMFLEEAENDFKQYIDLDHQEYEKNGQHAYGAWAGYNDLAWIYFLQGNFTEAEKVSRQGLEMSPENPWLLNMMATSLIEQDKCREAKTYLEQAQFFADKMSAEEFGEAYTGDNKKWWPKGLQQMQQTIKDNIKICLAKF